MSIKLRPHHITSFINFNSRKEYNLSDNDFVDGFNSRNKKMAHSRNFILYWKNFCNDLRNDPGAKISYCEGEDIICKNCDIRTKCSQKNSELNLIAKRLDENAKQKLRLSDIMQIEAEVLINRPEEILNNQGL